MFPLAQNLTLYTMLTFSEFGESYIVYNVHFHVSSNNVYTMLTFPNVRESHIEHTMFNSITIIEQCTYKVQVHVLITQ